MRLLLVAPPGAGKGTQAAKLAAHYGIVHISSGELLRNEVASGTELGRIAADYLRRGDLVPDATVIEMLATPILEAVGNGGYILDGFPRTVRQAEEAYEIARQVHGVELQVVVHLEVDGEELRRRLLRRGQGEGRSDDAEDTISHRLGVFDAETRPMLQLYSQRNLVVTINGDQPVEQVFADIVAAVDDRVPVGDAATAPRADPEPPDLVYQK